MQATDAQITAWKAQHGDVFEIAVKVSDDDTAYAYLKPANRNVVAVGLAKTMKNQVLEAGEFVLINCFVGGDERLRLSEGQAESPAQIAAAIAAAGMVEILDAVVKKR